MAYYLGIDGGGTKTTCLIGDETRTLGSGIGPASNPVRVGEARAREALTAAIRQACVAARIAPSQITRTCIGLAGGARPQISAPVRQLLGRIVPGEIEVVGDMVIAFEAAFAGTPGVIVIAGTGSIAYGANAEAQTARAGGWGFAVSDEGSGHWIGSMAVSSVLRVWDEDETPKSSVLSAAILKTLAVETKEQLVLAVNATPAADFASLFPAVVAAADAGEAPARDVLTQSGKELARLVRIVIRKLFPDDAAVPVAMAGGVFANSSIVREVFYNTLRAEAPSAGIGATIVEPVQGALALARKK